jgi:hypothetical protein
MTSTTKCCALVRLPRACGDLRGNALAVVGPVRKQRPSGFSSRDPRRELGRRRAGAFGQAGPFASVGSYGSSSVAHFATAAYESPRSMRAQNEHLKQLVEGVQGPRTAANSNTAADPLCREDPKLDGGMSGKRHPTRRCVECRILSHGGDVARYRPPPACSRRRAGKALRAFLR